MNKLKSLYYKLEQKFADRQERAYERKAKLKYPDYDPIVDVGDTHMLLGTLYGHDDLEIYYNRKTEMYSLGIETCYMFKGYESEVEYLFELLEEFTKFMDKNGYDTNYKPFLYLYDMDGGMFEATSIVSLYCKFRMFVYGYAKIKKEE